MNRSRRAKYRRLSDTASLWKKGHASLLVSPELDIALDWHEQEKPTKAWADRYGGEFDLSMEFLDASVAERQAKAERERRDARRKFAILVGTAGRRYLADDPGGRALVDARTAKRPN